MRRKTHNKTKKKTSYQRRSQRNKRSVSKKNKRRISRKTKRKISRRRKNIRSKRKIKRRTSKKELIPVTRGGEHSGGRGDIFEQRPWSAGPSPLDLRTYDEYQERPWSAGPLPLDLRRTHEYKRVPQSNTLPWSTGPTPLDWVKTEQPFSPQMNRGYDPVIEEKGSLETQYMTTPSSATPKQNTPREIIKLEGGKKESIVFLKTMKPPSESGLNNTIDLYKNTILFDQLPVNKMTAENQKKNKESQLLEDLKGGPKVNNWFQQPFEESQLLEDLEKDDGNLVQPFKGGAEGRDTQCESGLREMIEQLQYAEHIWELDLKGDSL